MARVLRGNACIDNFAFGNFPLALHCGIAFESLMERTAGAVRESRDRRLAHVVGHRQRRDAIHKLIATEEWKGFRASSTQLPNAFRTRSPAEPPNPERRRSKGRRLFHAHIKLVETNYLAASAPPTDGERRQRSERGRWFLVHVCVRCSFRMSSGSICEQRIKVNETSNFCSLCSLVSIPFRLFVRASFLLLYSFPFLRRHFRSESDPKRFGGRNVGANALQPLDENIWKCSKPDWKFQRFLFASLLSAHYLLLS